MKNLKQIRVALSLVFLVEAAAFVLLGPEAPRHTEIAFRMQIVPSMLASSMGAVLTWIVATLFLGRVYCSTVCPLGTVQDIMTFARGKTGRPLSHRFAPPRRIRYDILIVYVVLTIAGATVGVLLEPWSWFSGIAGALSSRHDAGIFALLARDAAFGIAMAMAALALLAAYAVLTGRDFCNHICPVGTALGIISSRAALHIEIDPDRCVSCLRCEEVCKASCISVKDRLVDNSRCVKCFSCLDVCPQKAIRYQMNRNGVMSPMMRKTTRPV